MGTSTTNEDDDGALDFWRDWDLSNLTEAEYLDRVLGPKYLPVRMVVPLTIVYVTIFVTGIFGNVATCTVIVRNASMQTATNYYLFSLAISDLTLLILGERTNARFRARTRNFSVLSLFFFSHRLFVTREQAFFKWKSLYLDLRESLISSV